MPDTISISWGGIGRSAQGVSKPTYLCNNFTFAFFDRE
jgi:hypothetical protein